MLCVLRACLATQTSDVVTQYKPVIMCRHVHGALKSCSCHGQQPQSASFMLKQ